MMYQSTFGFHLRPFTAAPRPDWFYQSETTANAIQSLTNCIERATGSAMLVGAAGTGKSLVCQVLAQKLRTTFSVVLLDSARLCTRRAFLQHILFELGLPFRDLEEGELRLSLMDYLSPSTECPNGMLLIADEAHVLPMRLLEELRMITNLVRDGQSRVRLVLAGNMSLEERFSHPKLEAFNQRISARCYLRPLNQTETKQYIQFQIEKASNTDADLIFSPDSIKTIYEMTGGLPRYINQLCDHALMQAATNGKSVISATMVAMAWSDLQQLPMPQLETAESVNEEAGSNASQSSVIEFGELDGDLYEPTESPNISEDETAVFTTPPVEATDLAPPSTTTQSIRSQHTDDQPVPPSDPVRALESISSVLNSLVNDSGSSRRAESPLTTEKEKTPMSELEPEFSFEVPDDPFGNEFESEEIIEDSFPTEQSTRRIIVNQKFADLPSDGYIGELDDEAVHEFPQTPQIESPDDNTTETGMPVRTYTKLNDGAKAEYDSQPNRFDEETELDKEIEQNEIGDGGDRDILLLPGKNTRIDQAEAEQIKPKAVRKEYRSLFKRLRQS